MANDLHAQAFILAGGYGTRLLPMTQSIPKSMALIRGKPILEHTINRLKEAGFLDIILAVSHLKENVMDYFGDGDAFGVRIKYAIEETPLGTGGAIKAYGNNIKGDFIMLNGDNLFDFELSKIYHFHKEKHPLATIGLTTVEDVSQFGVAKMDGDRITEFVEKPKNDPPSHLIDTGIYMIDPSLISMLPEGVSNIAYEFEHLVRDNMINGFVYSGKWMACDTPELYEKAAKEWS